MDPLQAALSSSFSVPNVPEASSSIASTASNQNAPPASQESKGVPGHAPTRSAEMEAERLAAMDDSWREAYDERLSEWKAENAVRREQSEKTRSDWEKRRSLEPANTQPFPSGPTSSIASSYVDARDLVSGEHEGGHGKEALDHVLSPNAKNNAEGTNRRTASGSGEDNSQGWENVPSESRASSFPSITFPPTVQHGNTVTRRSRTGQDDSRDDRGGSSGTKLTLPPVAPPSVTLSVFDSSLSTRARALALASSLAINLLLPFINGIMLGFGEIAAKSLFGWSGWPEVAGTLGLRGVRPQKEKQAPPRR